MALIDKDTLKAYIEKEKSGLSRKYEDENGAIIAFNSILNFIDSLETKEPNIEKHILDFTNENDYRPSNYPPKKNGFYMTIRCGYGGIYSKLNEWRDGHWMVECADGSKTIAYSQQPFPKEKVKEWLELLLKKSKNGIRKDE